MATPVVMPRLGDFMTEGQVSSWAKSDGERVAQGEVIAQIESEKLNYDLEASQDGIFHALVAEGETVPVDGLLAYLLAEGEAPPARDGGDAGPPTEATAPAPPRSRSRVRRGDSTVPSTPGARRLAANLGVDIALVTPTGPRGRVVDADVRAYAAGQEAESGPQIPRGLPTPSKVAPLDGMRKSIANHMRDSLAGTAQLSYFLEVDVTEAQRLRRETSRETGQVITLAHVLIMACARTLQRVPAHNSVLADGNVLYFEEVNIGLAVALDDGLIVPVIRNVQDMSIFEVSDKTHDLAVRARENRLSPDEVVGGTFTISVLGTVDGFTPILNAGQSSILGVGRTVQKPVVRGGEIVVREMLTVSLTSDHQVIDGAVAAAFLRRFQQIIERPSALFG